MAPFVVACVKLISPAKIFSLVYCLCLRPGAYPIEEYHYMLTFNALHHILRVQVLYISTVISLISSKSLTSLKVKRAKPKFQFASQVVALLVARVCPRQTFLVYSSICG
jgi:hypothetical protein